jgi:GTP-binding protein HflX
MMDEQKAQVEKILSELDVAERPVIEVLNKIDLVGQDQRSLLPTGDGVVAVSGLTGEGLDELVAAIDRALVRDPLVDGRFRVPQSEGAVLAALEAGAVVSEKRFEGNLAYVRVVGPASLLGRYRRFQSREEG